MASMARMVLLQVPSKPKYATNSKLKEAANLETNATSHMGNGSSVNPLHHLMRIIVVVVVVVVDPCPVGLVAAEWNHHLQPASAHQPLPRSVWMLPLLALSSGKEE